MTTAEHSPILQGFPESVTRRGEDLKQWRREQGLTRLTFAQIAHLSERTVATCEKSDRLPPKSVRPVKETVRLIAALTELTGNQASLQDWLQQRNPAFEDRTPLDVVRAGEVGRLWEMIYQLRSGEFA